MSYDFKTSANRENTNAEKYVLKEKLFGTEDVLPVWVADMDIDTPDFVLDAVKTRLNHPNFGYEEMPSSAYLAQIEWMKNVHGIEFGLEDMFYSHSVVASMNAVIEAFSDEGDAVVVQTPVYPPFFQSVLKHKRVLIKNPLKVLDNGVYTFDIEDLKSKISKNTKLLLLSSPHNPVGRVWKKEELEQILELCLENNIIVFSDEIHSDLTYEPNKHIPFASLSERAKDITITAMGVGKTFNMAGFAISTIAIQNKELREKFNEVYNKIHFAQGTVFGHVGFEAAYKNGKVWLDELKAHLQRNFSMLESVCEKFSHAIKVTPIEATYLAWLDCRSMKMSDKELRRFFVNEAKLGLNPGILFGREGNGFMRLNFAVSHGKMLQIIEQLENALQNKFRK